MQKARRPAASIRFSLLLLEEGEEYLKDVVGTCSSHGTTNLPGKLRLASKSLFFDPDDFRIPITRLPFSSMQSIEATGTSPSFVLTASSSTSMKASNKDAPYDITRHSPPTSWTFLLSYAPLKTFLPTLSSLYQAAKLTSKVDRMRAMEIIVRKLDEESPFTFDTSRLVDYNEKVVWTRPCVRISPLTRERGILVISDLRLYFQPRNCLAGPAVKSHAIQGIAALARRRFSLRPLGLEVFFSPSRPSEGPRWEGGSAFFVFSSEEVRESAMCALNSRAHHQGEGEGQRPVDRVLSMKLLGARGSLLACQGQWMSHVTLAWQTGKVSNYDYLLFLNFASGRTFNDLAQFPVMPWVLCNYVSQSIDLEDESNYRVLSKPVGALNASRLAEFKKRFVEMQADHNSGDEGAIPPFLYGTHYSSPGYVMYWLLRSSPGQMLRLQNGKFDAADRAFSSIAESWALCLTSSTDVKELIPAFFNPNPSFLLNSHQLALGVKQNGKPVGDVELPPWAYNLGRGKGRSPEETFLAVNRAALESAHVSSSLHCWIDLIFGFKQKGREAIEADNLFFHLTYENAVSDEAVSRMDAVELQALETQVQEFGQCPTQLFSDPHPPRLVCPPTPPFESFYQRPGPSSSDEDDNALSLLGSIISAIDDDALKDKADSRPIQATSSSSKLLSSPPPLAPAASPLIEPPHESFAADLGDLGLLLKSAGMEQKASPSQSSPSLLDLLNDKARLKIEEVKISKDPINAVSISEEGLVTLACNNGLVRWLDDDGSRIQSIRLEGDLLSLSSLISHSAMAIGSSLGVIHLLGDKGVVPHSWTAHDDAVCCLSSSRTSLFSSSYDCSVKTWDAEGVQKDEIREFESGIWALLACELTPDLIFTGTEEGLVESHDMRSPSGSRRIWASRASKDYIGGLALETNQHRIVVAAADGGLSVLDSRMAGAKVTSVKTSSPLRSLIYLNRQSFQPAALAGNERGLIEILDSSGNLSSWALPFAAAGDIRLNHGAINSMAYHHKNNQPLRIALATESGSLVKINF